MAEGVSCPLPTEEVEGPSSEPLLKDKFQIWDHIWGQMFTKVPRSAGEVSTDDLVEETVKGVMKVRTSSYLFCRFDLYLDI